MHGTCSAVPWMQTQNCTSMLIPSRASQVALVVKNLPAGDIRDSGSIPGSGRSLGGGHGNPLQYSCLENPMDRGAWRAIVHRVSKSPIWLKRLSAHVHWSWINPFFSGAIPGSIVKTNILMACIEIQRKPLTAPRWASKQIQFPQYLNSRSLFFSWTLGFEGRSLSWIQVSTLFAFWSSPGLIQNLF